MAFDYKKEYKEFYLPKTVALMHEYIASQGYSPDLGENRLHHEIYLSDPRKCAPEKLRTVIRHPIK